MVLLSHGADVNARDKNWQTPKHISAANGAYDSLKLLLEDDEKRQVDMADRAGRTALHMAAHQNHRQLCDLLLKHGANVNRGDKRDRTALHYAASCLNEDVVSLLLAKQADPNAQDKDGMTALHVVSGQESDHRKSVCSVIHVLREAGADITTSDRRQNTAFHIACSNFNANALDKLIAIFREDEEEGLDDMVNARNETLLHAAAAALDAKADDFFDASPLENCVEILLKETSGCLTAQNVDGQTPLHLACVHGCVMRIKLLIENGADVNATDKAGQTPLHLAAVYGHVVVVDMLLSAGADPRKTDARGRTCLHVSASSESKTSCSKLVETLDDPKSILNAKDKEGKTCVHYSVLSR